MQVYTEKKNGRWNVHVVVHVDGKRRDRRHATSVPCNDSDNKGRRRALDESRQWIEEMERTLAASCQGSTTALHEYCREHLSSKLSMGQIEPSTMVGYSTYLNYIEDYFESMALSDVTTTDVEGFIAWLREKKGLQPNTIKKCYNVLKACMRHAVVSHAISWNPCDAVKSPKQSKVPPNPLTEESRQEFLRRMAGLPLTPEVMGVWICYYTGCRRGEVAHLRWRDITYGQGGAGSFATITGAIGEGKGGSYEKGTKSGEERVVPLPDALVSLLRRRQSAMVDECVYAGIAFDSGMFVCGEIDGRWMNPYRLTKWWSAHRTEWRLMGVQGKPPVLHDLRHTYATIAVRNMDPKTAQSILGHADISMTMAYAATDLSHLTAAGSAMAGALG